MTTLLAAPEGARLSSDRHPSNTFELVNIRCQTNLDTLAGEKERVRGQLTEITNMHSLKYESKQVVIPGLAPNPVGISERVPVRQTSQATTGHDKLQRTQQDAAKRAVITADS